MTPKTGLSIVICTFNRAALLGVLLDSIPHELGDCFDAEIIVVDNNCTDNTAAIVAAHPRAPRLVREPRQGLSHARNCGVANATRENVLFLDDDARIPSGYFSHLAALLSTVAPDLFGGPVRPLFDQPPPDWFPKELETRSYAKSAGFSHIATLSGGNFGARREVLQRLGPFDTTLGMCGDIMAFGEDREMVERYRRLTPPAQQRLFYDPALWVEHHVGAEKLNKAYQKRRSYETAFARERVFIGSGVRCAARSRVLAAGRYALAPLTFIATVWRGGFSKRARFLAVTKMSGLAGRLAGAFSAPRSPEARS